MDSFKDKAHHIFNLVQKKVETEGGKEVGRERKREEVNVKILTFGDFGKVYENSLYYFCSFSI